MRKRLLFMTAFFLCVATWTHAQERIVRGTVTSGEDGTALPGVNVVLKGTTNGTVTDTNGSYQLPIPQTGGSLIFSFIGLKSEEIAVGDRSVVDVSLTLDVTQLGEIVVTGVAEGTSIKKIGFALTKVSGNLLSEVPAVDAANALRGKVSGVQILQGSGTPGRAASIRLRGATTISTGVSSDPLIIIDGVITPPGSSSLADINMNDVASMEVVKGAAGSALYGSLAGNGVIQIITKRGLTNTDKTAITFRSEYGVSQLQKTIPVNMHHNYQVDANGQLVTDASGNYVDDTSPFNDNKWPTTFNAQKELFKSRPFYANYISVASGTKKTSFFSSFDNTSQSGVIDGMRSFDRQNLRLNVDHSISDKIQLSMSTLFVNSMGPGVTGEGSQAGLIYDVMRLSPGTNPYESNFDGQPYNTTSIGIGQFNAGRNSDNPLYTAHNDKFTIARQRMLANYAISYQIFDWWKADAQISFDRAARDVNRFRDKYYLTSSSSTDDDPYVNSSIFKSTKKENAKVYSATSTFNKRFGNLSAALSLRYQAEEYTVDFNRVSSITNSVQVSGIDQTTNIPTGDIRATSYDELFRAENYFANLKLDYSGKYILEGLLRRDASSLFGANQREQLFYRVSGAYRLSEDFALPGIQELKLRASLGTSGQRPPYDAQYESIILQDGVYSFGTGTKGNRDLKPSRITEFETGINVSFLNRFNAEVNYATSNADDQILLVPLSPTSGYANQWQNAGSVESSTFEFSLGANVIKSDNIVWDLGVVGSRSVSTITKLNRSEFGYEGGGVGSGAIFRIKEGERLGAAYGGLLATNLNQLTVDGNGNVNNLQGVTGRKPNEFVINRDGFVILNGTEFTPTEVPYNLIDPATGSRIDTKIADGTPDLILGLNSTFTYKGFSLYALVDAQIGGDIVNVNKQNLMFNEVAAEHDQSGFPEGQRKYPSYFVTLSNSGQAPNNYFVEDGSFTTIREVSLSYLINRSVFSKLGKLGDVIQDAKLSFTGRNLHTFTKYSGWTPEVAASGGPVAVEVGENNAVETSPFNFRADYGAVPLFRTYTVSLQLRF